MKAEGRAAYVENTLWLKAQMIEPRAKIDTKSDSEEGEPNIKYESVHEAVMRQFGHCNPNEANPGFVAESE